jgi:hypothetical protein
LDVSCPTKPRRPDPQFLMKEVVRVHSDAEADMPLAEASGAICVQRFDDSRNSAIHITYRISLRSSSLREPRYPLLRVIFGCRARECSNILHVIIEWYVGRNP